MGPDDDTRRRLLLRGRFTFGLKHAIAAAFIGCAIAVAAALSNLP